MHKGRLQNNLLAVFGRMIMTIGRKRTNIPSCYYYDRYDGKNVKKYSMPSGQICRIIPYKCSKAADKYAAGSL